MSTQNIPFSISRRKISLNYPKSAAVGFFQGTQERVRNSRGRRAIRVRAIEVLLYLGYGFTYGKVLNQCMAKTKMLLYFPTPAIHYLSSFKL